MLITNKLAMEVWRAVEQINDRIVESQLTDGSAREAYIEGNTSCLQIMFMGSSLWNSEENDTGKAVGIFEDAMEELNDILNSLKKIEV